MYLFDNPSYLYLTLIIPIVIIINWFYMAWRNKIQKYFSNNKLLDQISPNRSNFKLNLKLVLELFVILFLMYRSCKSKNWDRIKINK
jgi:hypothetical protein